MKKTFFKRHLPIYQNNIPCYKYKPIITKPNKYMWYLKLH